MITFTQALLVALFYWLSNSYWLTNGAFRFSYPVCNGLVIGLIMGDPLTGTMLGGLLQTMNMAPSNVGATITMDMKMASFITIPMCIAGNIDPEVIVAFAVPFTVLGAFLQPLTRTLNQIGVDMADKAALEGNTGKYYFVQLFMQPIIQFPFYFGIMFIALYFGQNAMSALIALIPEWLMVSFINLAKFLPGIGFAMFLRSMNKKNMLPIFFLGFYVMYFFKSTLSLVAITIFAVIIAAIFIFPVNQKEAN